MAGKAVYLTRDLAEAALKEIQADWPAAKIVPFYDNSNEPLAVACDYAEEKYLHTDGHIY